MTIRYSGEKESIGLSDVDKMAADVQKRLFEIHDSMLEASRSRLAQKTFRVGSYAEMKEVQSYVVLKFLTNSQF